MTKNRSSILLGIVAVVTLVSVFSFGFQNYSGAVENFLLYFAGIMLIAWVLLLIVLCVALRREENEARRRKRIIYYSILTACLLWCAFLYLFKRDLVLGYFHAS